MATNPGFGRKTGRNIVRAADDTTGADISVEEITIEDDISVVHDIPEESRVHADRFVTEPVVPKNVALRRSALIEETSSGKRPRSVGWWLQVLTLPLLALLGVAVWLNVVRIQDNVEAAAAQILRDSGIDTSTLTFDASFRDVEVSGTLPPNATAAEIERLLESETGPSGEDIRNATVTASALAVGLIDIVVTADGSTLLVSGEVPTDADLDAISAAAEQAGVALTTNIGVSGIDAESDDHDALIAALVAILPHLDESISSAELRLDNSTLSGSIETASSSARAELERIPEVANSSVIVSSLGELNAEVTYDGSRIVLNGDVLTVDQRTSLVNAASDAVSSENVVNNLTVLSVEEAVDGSDERIEAVADVLRTFDGFNVADAQVTDTNFTVNGEAFDPTARVPIDNALGAVTSSGLQLSSNITLGLQFTLQEEIDLLQAELDALQEQIRENVRFTTNSATLTDQAGSTLDEVVAAMARYTRPVVEVGGHSDSLGNNRFNRQLSADRATAVADYIEGAGIDASRLNSVGYGERRPLADNTTAAGREENRRVEFTARESF